MSNPFFFDFGIRVASKSMKGRSGYYIMFKPKGKEYQVPKFVYRLARVKN